MKNEVTRETFFSEKTDNFCPKMLTHYNYFVPKLERAEGVDKFSSPFSMAPKLFGCGSHDHE